MRIIENSKKPAIGGGITNLWPWRESMSSIIPREASASSMLRASASGFFPEARSCFSREGLDRKQCDKFGLRRREQDLEDLKQKIGRRGSLREAVDTLRQFAIALPGGVVRHGNSLGRIGSGASAGITGVCSFLFFPGVPVVPLRGRSEEHK